MSNDAYQQMAQAIIDGQSSVMGACAVSMATRVSGIDVSDQGAVTITGDGSQAVDELVKTYSAITGQLGVRMCYRMATDVISAHPEASVPSFAAIG